MSNHERKLGAVIEVAALALGTKSKNITLTLDAEAPGGVVGKVLVLRVGALGIDPVFALGIVDGPGAEEQLIDTMLRAIVALYAAPRVVERAEQSGTKIPPIVWPPPANA